MNRMVHKSKPKICIIGSGFVGQATGKGFVAKGFNVTFLDINPSKVQQLTNEGYKAYHPDDLKNGSFDFDITFLSVPTPTANKKIDLSKMEEASKYLGKRLYALNKYHLVVVKSTVLPGTTENLVIKTVEKYSGKSAGRDFGICMNPEYLRERFADEDFIKSWVVVIGEYDHRSGNLLEEIYEDFDCPKYRVSIQEAEIQKYVHNLFNAVKVTFFNEMRQICNEAGLDPELIFPLVVESAEGVWNPFYGLKDKGPFQGNCLPKDTQAFLSWAEENGYSADLLKQTIQVNERIAQNYTQKQKNIQMPKRGKVYGRYLTNRSIQH